MPDSPDGTVTEPGLERDGTKTAIAAHEELVAMRGALAIIATRSLGPGPDTEDVVQDVLERALAALHLGRVAEGTRLAPFVYGIARHVITDVIRRRRGNVEGIPDVDSLETPGGTTLDSLVRAEEAETVRRACASLPPADLVLLRRCFVAGESIATIARSMGEPAARLRKRKSRALDRLRHALGLSTNSDT